MIEARSDLVFQIPHSMQDKLVSRPDEECQICCEKLIKNDATGVEKYITELIRRQIIRRSIVAKLHQLSIVERSILQTRYEWLNIILRR